MLLGLGHLAQICIVIPGCIGGLLMHPIVAHPVLAGVIRIQDPILEVVIELLLGEDLPLLE